MKMKILTAVSLFIFFVVIVAILITGLVFFQKPAGNSTANQTLSASPAIKEFSAVEVSGHSSAESCWTIVHEKVYDVTGLVSIHSGGSEAILNVCGKDGSVGFDTKYGKGSHSDRAKASLETYYIGDLKK